ncbi:tetratricopeptide repeat protein [Massilia sp. R2A-15]|uniref:tetratricopeptide repeat protein n=1 Tax=Massilia sp. R2A-15 TaxID=3064278 RepID=UPI0027338A91|nr:tetratricopeptide repeat protein [Massilia sp. R2A-15]WLI89497.1 tetratricopeptide repeat protein [Massilia sp. R2A-15]
MKNAFAIVTLAGLLTACAAPLRQAAPEPAAPAPAPAAASATAPEPEPVAAVAEPEEAPAPAQRLPNVALSKELLYKLMKAELEFRKGNWQPAYLSMMVAAQQTRDPRLAQRATEMAMSARQGEPTLAAIRLWRELAPESEEASQYHLAFIVMSDNIAEAEPILAERLKTAAAGERGLAMFQAQQLLARAKDKAGAAAMLERLVAPYAATLEAHVVLAQAAYGRGDKEGAAREAAAALAIKPDSEIAVLMLAQVSGDEAAAEKVLAQFLAAHPGAREVRSAHARTLVSGKQYGPARDEFLALLKGQPDNLGTLYALGVMSLQLNDNKGAEDYFTRFAQALAAKPDSEADGSKVFVILAQLAEERGDTKAALQWLDKVEQGEGGAWFNAQLKRAALVAKQGDVPGARKLVAGLAPTQPAEQAQLVLADGQILRDAGQVEAAYAVMRAGVEKYPTNPDLLYDFALLAEKTGRLDVMEASLRKVMREVPDNHHAYNALGYSLAERNVRLQEAYELIDKALKLAPGDPFIMDSMGWVQYRLGNLSAAEAQLRQAYALRSDPEIAVHLGEVLWQKGDKADAQKLWREARSKDPQNDTLKNTLARLRLSL